MSNTQLARIVEVAIGDLNVEKGIHIPHIPRMLILWIAITKITTGMHNILLILVVVNLSSLITIQIIFAGTTGKPLTEHQSTLTPWTATRDGQPSGSIMEMTNGPDANTNPKFKKRRNPL